ncbi:sulfite exporter TauE/SafE family protein [bacterium]|nr:sulfite exporter TauE/SafE family protein [bacterium]
MNEIYRLIAIFFAGGICSFINVMAGGGSVLTLGIMMLLGIDASVANGTNRIGILVGTASGAMAYKSENYMNFRDSLKLAAFTIPGAIIGSIFAVRIDNLLFERVLAIVMIFIVITLFIPKKNIQKLNNKTNIKNILIYPAMFLVGIYGGFIQAGVGFLIMASLRHILRMELVTINLHKVYIVLIYTIPLLFIFGFTGNINLLYGLCLASGSAIGAWLSVKLSLKKGEKVIKIILGIALLLMAVKFLLSIV